MLRIMEYREQQPSTTEKPMIRFNQKSDLGRGRERLLQNNHKKFCDCCELWIIA